MSRVYGDVRLLAGILLLTAGSAAADSGEDHGVHPVPRFSVGLYAMIHGGAINGVGTAGIGPNVELALGVDRTQYFIEGMYGYSGTGRDMQLRNGTIARAAAGVRWIARSFDLDGAAIEMTLEGLAGAHRYNFDGDTLSRPEFAAGVAMQLRRYRRSRIVVKFSLRAFWAPTDRDTTDVIARGSAADDRGPLTNGGVMALIGAAR